MNQVAGLGEEDVVLESATQTSYDETTVEIGEPELVDLEAVGELVAVAVVAVVVGSLGVQ